MKTPHYDSVLKEYIHGLLEEKQLHGFQTHRLIYDYAEIDRYIQAHIPQGIHINEQYFNEWLAYADNPNLSRKTVYRKVSSFRQLLVYMNSLGIPCYIPRLPRENEHSFVPYIFTETQMQDIFDACDSLEPKTFCQRTCIFAMPALIRLLYSTGMRLGEALSFKNKDVNFKKRHIVLNDTKNRHQRLAPINTSLESVLKAYLKYRNKITCKPVTDAQSFFFVNNRGEVLNEDSVRRQFQNHVLAKAGIPYIGHHAGPRIHDIRHTACVHALKKLVAQGYDLYCSMPLLANFMVNSQF